MDAGLGCRNAVELVQRITGCAAAAAAITDVLTPALRVTALGDVGVAEAEIVSGSMSSDPSQPPPFDAGCVQLQARVWHCVLDPDGAAPTERDAERRSLRLLAPRHGLVPVTGMLLPEVAGALRQYADACTNPRTPDLAGPAPGEPAATDGVGGAAVGGEVVCDGQDDLAGADHRGQAQQLHDVLAVLIGVVARTADAPSVAGNPPTLMVSVNAEDLASGRGAAFADGAPPISIDTSGWHVRMRGGMPEIKAPPWLDRSGQWRPAIGSPARIAAARAATARSARSRAA